MSSVGEELLNEIERVSAKRERWRGYAKDAGPQVVLAPGIMLMTMAIDAGKAALMSGDPVSAIRVLEDLRGYDDND